MTSLAMPVGQGHHRASEDLHLLDVSYPDAMAAITGSEADYPDLPGAQDFPCLASGTSCSSYGIRISSGGRAPKSGAPHRMELQPPRGIPSFFNDASVTIRP